MIENKLAEHRKTQEDIFDYFGHQETARTYPLDEQVDNFWTLKDGVLRLSESESGLNDEDDCWEYTLLPEHLTCEKKNTYIRDEYSMLLCDTKCNGNFVLCVLKNSNQR
jgi:hypothetical protein